MTEHEDAEVDLRTLASVSDLSVPAWRRRLARAGVHGRRGDDGRNFYRWSDVAPLIRRAEPRAASGGAGQLYRRLGQAVERERRARGMSRTTLAATLHVARATVAGIEQGTHASSVARLVDVARALDATPAGVLAAALGTEPSPVRRFVVLHTDGQPVADGVLWPDRSVSVRTRGPEPVTRLADTLQAALEPPALGSVRWTD
jgi:transcriptional regulator with XRE-family HTH domain